MRDMGYDNIGTVEMLRGADGSFNFLEMNTRLQVEHGVTEEVTGVDLVQAQIRSRGGREARGHPAARRSTCDGHAIQARVYAEDPKNFFPSPGKLNVFRPPQATAMRVETGFAEGRDVTPHYDPMIAKVIVHAPTRDAAIDRLVEALEAFEIQGLKNNIPAVLAILRSEPFRAGDVHTGLIPEVLAGRKSVSAWNRERRSIAEARARRAARALDEADRQSAARALRHRRAEDAGRQRRGRRRRRAAGLQAPGRRESRLARHPAQERRGRRQSESPDRRRGARRDRRDGGAAEDRRARASTAGWSKRWRRAGQEMVSAACAIPHFGPLVMVGLGGIFVEVLAGRRVSHLPDHAHRCRGDDRRAQRRGDSRKARAAASPLRATRSSTCC